MTPTEMFTLIQRILSYSIFSINQTQITLGSIFMLFVVMVIVLFVSKILVKKILARILTKTNMDTGTQYTLTRITEYLVIMLGGILAFQMIGVDLSGLIVIFGFLSVGIGFGLQNVTSNFISGLILLFERPIAVGDRVMVGDTEGDVEEIHIRSTIIKTVNNVSIIVPNSEFVSSNVINWTYSDPKVRLDISIGVSYDSDLDLVLNSLKEVAEDNADVLVSPKPEVLFLEFGDSSWNLELRIWIDEPTRHWHVRSDINCAIVRKFRENKIEIPFPQRDLHLRSPLPVPIKSNA